jgi:DnaJ-class molecular chaperone
MSIQAPFIKPIRSARYSLEQCVQCAGTGYRCPACEGNGLVLVRDPATKCKHCEGTGLERNRSRADSLICVTCYGTGWDMVVRNSPQ